MIRHAGLFLPAPAPVLALAVAMIELAFGALLVPLVGLPPLSSAGLIAACDAAIAVPAIAVRAEEKHGVAVVAETNSMKENRVVMNRRHAWLQARLDNGTRIVAGWNQLCLVYLTKVAEPGTLPLLTAGFSRFTPLMTQYFVRPA